VLPWHLCSLERRRRLRDVCTRVGDERPERRSLGLGEHVALRAWPGHALL
jgi:hypothetical protein